MDPATIIAIADQGIADLCDLQLFNALAAQEEKGRTQLHKLAERCIREKGAKASKPADSARGDLDLF